MKLMLFDNRKRFVPCLCIGPVMWRCSWRGGEGRPDGRPNYRLEIRLVAYSYTSPDSTQRTVTPAIVFKRWHRSTLASIEPLGVESFSVSIGIEWWRWTRSLGLLVTHNTKTQAEVDAAVKEANA